MRPKATADVAIILSSFCCFPLTPLNDNSTLFSSANLIFVLIYVQEVLCKGLKELSEYTYSGHSVLCGG